MRCKSRPQEARAPPRGRPLPRQDFEEQGQKLGAEAPPRRLRLQRCSQRVPSLGKVRSIWGQSVLSGDPWIRGCGPGVGLKSDHVGRYSDLKETVNINLSVNQRQCFGLKIDNVI